MKLALYFFGTVILTTSNLSYSFSYDSAIYAAQKGSWQDAHAALNSIVTNKPDNDDVVYDAGVAAYNLGNFSQAAACFMRAAELAHHDDKKLCFRAHFNAGNAFVDDKNLKRALEQYDKALVIEPNNEQARHNRDRVAQMLQESSSAKASKDKQEKQQDQQKKDDQKKNQDQQDKREKDQGGNDQSGDDNDQQGNDNDQQQQDGGQQSDQSGDKKNKQGGDQSSSAKATEDRSDQEAQGEQGDGAEHGDKNAQRKEHGDKEQQQKKPADNKERNGDHELDEKADSAQSEQDKQQGNKHNKAPEKQNTTNDKTNVPAEGGREQAKEDDKYGLLQGNQARI